MMTTQELKNIHRDTNDNVQRTIQQVMELDYPSAGIAPLLMAMIGQNNAIIATLAMIVENTTRQFQLYKDEE